MNGPYLSTEVRGSGTVMVPSVSAAMKPGVVVTALAVLAPVALVDSGKSSVSSGQPNVSLLLVYILMESIMVTPAGSNWAHRGVYI